MSVNRAELRYSPALDAPMASSPHPTGYYGRFGGRFVAETLVPALEELAGALDAIVRGEAFQREWRDLLATYVGRPTPARRGQAARPGDRPGGPRPRRACG